MKKPWAVLAAALLAALAGLACFAFIFQVFASRVFDPGAVVRWGMPAAVMLFHLLISLLVGVLVTACYILSPRFDEYRQALRLARMIALILVPLLLACIFLSYLDITGVFPGQSAFAQALQGYLASNLAGAWLLTLAAAMLISLALLFVERQSAVAWVTVLAAAALVPVAFQSHSAGTGSHHTAVTASALHALGISIWVGGVFSLIWLWRYLPPPRLTIFLRRFSTLAFSSFFITAISGFISGLVRFTEPQQLFTTAYGITLTAKTVIFILLGFLGAYSRFLLRKAPKSRRLLLRIVSGELILMGLIFGISGVLARMSPPVSETPPDPKSRVTPAELLTGAPLPPPESFINYLTQWTINPIWLLAAIWSAAGYAWAVRRLSRRKDHWPWGRTISWMLGIVTLLYLTNGGVMVYGTYLFSAHMVMHMTLGMLTPILLALGAPITLLMRSVSMRKDGSRGLREWALLVLHSRYFGLISSPPMAAAIFILSMWFFYFSDLFRWAVSDPLGHQWMVFHFLLSGYLFAQSLLMTDPSKHRFGYPARLLVLVLAMASHAFFGVLVMSADYLMLPDWFGAMGRTWGAPPLLDQRIGGAVAWGITEIPTIFLVIILCFRWFRDDQKEARRKDRMADRDGDAALRAYNERLAGLSERD